MNDMLAKAEAEGDYREMYYKRCDACNCYEYDCRGADGCIKLAPGYVGAHERSARRVTAILDVAQTCDFCDTNAAVSHLLTIHGAPLGAVCPTCKRKHLLGTLGN